ncbi:Membrane transporter [Pseudozyma hubeiensis]|nr:Membrane transporter [Pseudozyma hubeiensis]
MRRIMRADRSASKGAISVLLIIFLGAALRASSAGISMGRTVKKFQESTDIWNQLDSEWLLPGYHSSFTNTPPTNGWINFLMKQALVTYTTVHLLDVRLIQFAKDPLAEKSFKVEHPVAKRVAAFLIEDYARYLETDRRNVLVYDALKRIHLERKAAADKAAKVGETGGEAQALEDGESEASEESTDPASLYSPDSLSPSSSSK